MKPSCNWEEELASLKKLAKEQAYFMPSAEAHYLASRLGENAFLEFSMTGVHVIPTELEPGLHLIAEDDEWHRRAVQVLATYYALEFQQTPMYRYWEKETIENQPKTFIWVVPSQLTSIIIGACVIRYREKATQSCLCRYEQPEGWAMQWLYFHPSCRRRGYLSLAWDELVENHGPFWLEEPLSRDMHSFILTHQKSHPKQKNYKVGKACSDSTHQSFTSRCPK